MNDNKKHHVGIWPPIPAQNVSHLKQFYRKRCDTVAKLPWKATMSGQNLQNQNFLILKSPKLKSPK